MLVTSNGFGLLHQQSTEALVLEFGRIAAVKRDSTAVRVQFTHNRRLSVFEQLCPIRSCACLLYTSDAADE